MKHMPLALLSYLILEIARQANNLEIISQKSHVAFMACMLLVWVAWLASLVMPHLGRFKCKIKSLRHKKIYPPLEQPNLIKIHGIASRDLSAEWAKIFQSAGVASKDVFMGILHD